MTLLTVHSYDTNYTLIYFIYYNTMKTVLAQLQKVTSIVPLIFTFKDLLRKMNATLGLATLEMLVNSVSSGLARSLVLFQIIY